MQITTESIQTQIPYYLTQKAADELAKALDRFPREIEYYLNQYPSDALQGDGWTSLEVIQFETGARKQVKGMLLSNSCDIDPENARDFPPKIIFAPLVKLDRYTALLTEIGIDADKIASKVAAIKEQKVTTVFYLPKGAQLDAEYIALLDDVHTMPFAYFSGIADKKKIFTLGQVGFYLFLLKLSVHFCRFNEQVDRDAE